MKNDRLLMVFVKNAVLGKAKTRLAATIGPEKALLVYRQLVAYTAKVASQAQADVAVYYDAFLPAEPDAWPSHTAKRLQEGADLGARMRNAFADAFAHGYKQVAIIGSDCPEITPEIIDRTWQLLHEADIAIGPADDGGYYLLAMKMLQAPLFEGKSWSTSTVAADTLADCQQLGLKVAQLPTLSDIDNEADWLRLGHLIANSR